MSKQLVVKLRTTKYLNQRAKDGSPIDEVINVKIIHNTVEYHNYLKHMLNSGFSKVELVSVTERTDEAGKISYKDIEIPENIKSEVAKALKGAEPELTQEQKKIAELEKSIELLKQAQAGNSVAKVQEPSDLDKARDDYKAIFGKKAHHSWDIETINSKIEEASKA